MANLDETPFLDRMKRLEEFRMRSSLRGPALLAAFEEEERASEKKQPPKVPFSVLFARQCLETHEERIRRPSSVRLSSVISTMEEDWFKDAQSPKMGAWAVQQLFRRIRKMETSR